MIRLFSAAMLMAAAALITADAAYGAEPVDSTAVKKPELKVDTLGEVTVTARLIEHKGNQDTYAVTSRMLKGIHSAGEMLGLLPGVFYNPVDRDLKYLGSGNVKLLIDGVERSDSYIKLINPKRFAKVVVDNHPSGQYDGYDAVINLITKTHYTGYDGVLLGSADYLPELRHSSSTPFINQNGQIEATYTRDKWNFALSGQFDRYDQGHSMGYEKYYRLNDYWQKVEQPAGSEPNQVNKGNMGSYSFYTDYLVNDNHRISAGITVGPSTGQSTERSIMTYGYGDTGEVGKVVNYDRTRMSGAMYVKGMLTYHGTVGGWALHAEAGLSDNHYRRYHEVERAGYRLDDRRRMKVVFGWGGASAVKRMLSNKLTLSMYDYATWADYKERNLVSERVLSDDRMFRNQLGADLAYSPVWKWSVGAGLGLNSISNSWGDMRATHHTPRLKANAMWSSTKVMVRFNYSAATAFPSLPLLQDYSTPVDSLIVQRGNPALKPTVTHNFNLMVNILRDLTLNGTYTIGHNAVYDIAEDGGSLVPSVVMDYRNGSSASWRANVNYTKMIRNFTIAVNAGVEGYRASYAGWRNTRTMPAYDWYVRYHNQPMSFDVFLSSSLHTGLNVTPQEVTWSRYDGYALAVQKYLLGSKLMVMFMWTPPLHFMKRSMTTSFDSPSYTWRRSYDHYNKKDNHMSLTVMWRFDGGNKTRKYSRGGQSVDITTPIGSAE